MQHLEQDDIQGLVARGYGKLASARFLLVQIVQADLARGYLRRISSEVNTVRTSPDDFALQIAFTSAGLSALGLPASALASFPREFLEGMDDPLRAAMLGDQGDSDPHRWSWGGPTTPRVHVLVLVYAKDEPTLERQLAAELDAIASHGLSVVADKRTSSRIDQKEHFGFRDGISSPILEGLARSPEKVSSKQWTHPLKSGELVLGYRNEYGSYTERPTVATADDPAGMLPEIPGGAMRDLGRNGTYLVYRELTQDVVKFWSYLEDASREPGSDPVARAIQLGAKMVGRWPGGAPLVRSPERDDPGKATDNQFGFWADQDGIRCPLGAHIRRANPRDRFPVDHSRADSIEMVRKHQMLRRGRPFGPPVVPSMSPGEILAARGHASDEQRGLHFICLVGHISRQFEVVQSAWLSSANFAGLFKDGDPLIGARRSPPDVNANDEFTCQAAPVRRKYKGLPQFTQLVGGAYFFLPGITALRFLARQP